MPSGQNQFDIILMDFRMPEINGLELLYEAKKYLSSYKAVLIRHSPPVKFWKRESIMNFSTK